MLVPPMKTHCDFEYDEEDGLETHIELFHDNDMELSDPMTDNQKQDDEFFFCDKCHLKFTDKVNLNQHKQAMHCSLLSF